jgi:hypothetical protein
MITQSDKDNFQDEAFWKRLSDRSQPEPSTNSKQIVLDAARLAMEKRQAVAKVPMSPQSSHAVPAPWWLALLSPRAWTAATTTALLVVGVWGWQHHSVTHSLVDSVRAKVAPANSVADDTALLLETDKKLNAIHQSVSGIMQDNRTAYVDFTLKAALHSAGILRQQTSGAVAASAEL